MAAAVYDSAEPGKFVAVRPENRLPRFHSVEGEPLHDVTVWMGNMYNNGEDAASRLVHGHRDTLRSFVYLPLRHKGGRMVRPHYYRNDRTKTMEFPLLETLGYWGDCGSPADIKWVAPNLKKLVLFAKGCLSRDLLLERWTLNPQPMVNLRQTFYPQDTLTQCPNLEEILCAEVTDPYCSDSYRIVRRLVPPCPLEWDKLKQLHLAKVAGRNPDESNVTAGPLSHLPTTLLDRIVSFCHQPHWKVEDFDLEEDDDGAT